MILHCLLLVFLIISLYDVVASSDKLEEMIASKVIYKDENKTVWEMTADPGEYFHYHTHSHDYIFYVVEGSTLEVLDKDGNVEDTIVANVGDVISFKVSGNYLIGEANNKTVMISRSHAVHNIGATRFKELLVEFHNSQFSNTCSPVPEK